MLGERERVACEYLQVGNMGLDLVCLWKNWSLTRAQKVHL